jgi:hypothetical protein
MTPLVIVVIAVSTAASQAASGAVSPSTPCPSFEALGRQLDRRFAQVKPGTTLADFVVQVAPRALDFDTPQSREGAMFDLFISEGNATVSDNLTCRFDRTDRLLSCRKECCRSRSRLIAPEVFAALAIGDTRASVIQRACSPSLLERKGSRVNAYYHDPTPIFGHDEGQTVLLTFEHERLVSKDKSPYY